MDVPQRRASLGREAISGHTQRIRTPSPPQRRASLGREAINASTPAAARSSRLNEGLLSEEKQSGSARSRHPPGPASTKGFSRKRSNKPWHSSALASTSGLNEGLLSEEKQFAEDFELTGHRDWPQRRASLGREAISCRPAPGDRSCCLNEGLLSEEKQFAAHRCE